MRILGGLISIAVSHLVCSPLMVQTENVMLEKWPNIDFTDDHEGFLFTATIQRKPVEELELVDHEPKSSPETKTKPGKRRERSWMLVGKEVPLLFRSWPL